tara:strand:- start:79 stop:426 length:348 start_codon:yes stop_codon:yes gene_type:complete
MNQEHEVTIDDEFVVNVNVEWTIADESHDWEAGNARGTRELYSTQVESIQVIMVSDLETGDLVDTKVNEETITSLLNDGQCTPEPPTAWDFRREAEEEEGARRAEEMAEAEYYGD